jgi:hypothetical protein
MLSSHGKKNQNYQVIHKNVTQAISYLQRAHNLNVSAMKSLQIAIATCTGLSLRLVDENFHQSAEELDNCKVHLQNILRIVITNNHNSYKINKLLKDYNLDLILQEMNIFSVDSRNNNPRLSRTQAMVSIKSEIKRFEKVFKEKPNLIVLRTITRIIFDLTLEINAFLPLEKRLLQKVANQLQLLDLFLQEDDLPEAMKRLNQISITLTKLL